LILSRLKGLKPPRPLAIYKEIASHAFYIAGQGKTQDPAAKALMKELAAQELEHKQRIEFLYTEVAFPQINGG